MSVNGVNLIDVSVSIPEYTGHVMCREISFREGEGVRVVGVGVDGYGCVVFVFSYSSGIYSFTTDLLVQR